MHGGAWPGVAPVTAEPADRQDRHPPEAEDTRLPDAAVWAVVLRPGAGNDRVEGVKCREGPCANDQRMDGPRAEWCSGTMTACRRSTSEPTTLRRRWLDPVRPDLSEAILVR